eukprot:357024-Chlamydomonas_euryale.AAC.1
MQVLAPALDAAVASSAAARRSGGGGGGGGVAVVSSPSLAVDLLMGCARMGLYRRPLVEAVVAWLLQPVHDGGGNGGTATAAKPGVVPGVPVVPGAGAGPEPGAGSGSGGGSGAGAGVETGAVPPRLAGLPPSRLCALAWALSTLRHDGGGAALAAASEAALLRESPRPARMKQQRAPQQQQQELQLEQLEQQQQLQRQPGCDAAAMRLSPKDINRLVGAWAKLNRHPGPHLLEAVTRQWIDATSGQVSSGGGGGSSSSINGSKFNGGGGDGTQVQRAATPGITSSASSGSSSAGGGTSGSAGGTSGSTGGAGGSASLAEASTVLYSLALLREHSCVAARHTARLVGEMVARARGSSGGAEAEAPGQEGALVLPQEVARQLRQIAAVMLAAQVGGCGWVYVWAERGWA